MLLSKNEHGYWEVRIKDRYRHWKSFSLHVKDFREAKDLVSKSRIREIEKAAEIGILNQEVVATLATGIRKMTVEEAIVHWRAWMESRHLAQNTIRRNLTEVYAWMSNCLKDPKFPIMDITEKHVDQWVNAISGRKLSTRKMMLIGIRNFISFIQEKGWILGNPAKLVRIDMDRMTHLQQEPKPSPIFLDSEVEELLRYTERFEFWHAAIAIGRYTGLRLSDIACLEWDCFLIPGKIAVWTQKRDKRVELPLEPEVLANAIAEIPKEDESYVFPKQREQALDPWHRQVLPTRFRQLCHACGIFGKSFHGLRATYITRCKEAGMPIKHISKAVGHSSEEMTTHYVRPIGT